MSTDLSAAQSQALATLQKKTRRVLQLRPEKLRDELSALSAFFTENNAHTRRNMRTSIEVETLRVHSRFLSDFSGLENALNDLETKVEALGSKSEEVLADLKTSRAKTQGAISEASRLREKRKFAVEKRKICESFLRRFRLTEEELDRIRLADAPIDSSFFAALDKVDTIRRNCKLMARVDNTGTAVNADGSTMDVEGGSFADAANSEIGFNSGIFLLNQNSALDVMQETTEILDIAYERLFISVQHQCRRMSSTTHGPDNFMRTASTHLKRSLQFLKNRPVYFNKCLRDIAKSRRQLLSSHFHDALIHGDGYNRPIEMQKSYDPVRYCGDMLAWIHEKLTTEKEGLTVFLGVSAGLGNRDKDGQNTARKSRSGSRGGSRAGGSRVGDGIAASTVGGMTEGFRDVVANDDSLLADLVSILDFVVEGLVESFKTRVDNLLNNSNKDGKGGVSSGNEGRQNHPIIVYYKIAQLFHHFGGTLKELLHENNSFVVLLGELHKRLYQQFLDLCNQHSQQMREDAQSGSYAILDDLSTPLFVMTSVKMIDQILEDVQTEDQFLPLVSAVYDPLLNYCRQMFPQVPCDRAVFLINCISQMVHPLRNVPCTTDRVALYDALIDEQKDVLVEHQSKEALEQLGLLAKINALKSMPRDAQGKVPLDQLHASDELHPVALSSVLRSFYTSLFTLKSLSMPHIEKITSRKVRNGARNGVSQKICEAYEELYSGIGEMGVATHTVEQVRMLLEV